MAARVNCVLVLSCVAVEVKTGLVYRQDDDCLHGAVYPYLRQTRLRRAEPEEALGGDPCSSLCCTRADVRV